jgi:hypothetical protein
MRNYLITAIMFTLLGLFLGTQIHGCKSGDCPPPVQIVKIDTVWVKPTDTILKVISRHVPALVAVRKWANLTTINGVPNKAVFDSKNGTQHNDSKNVVPGQAYSINDTIQQVDTLYKLKAYRFIINDLITGNRIVSRQVQYANLAPMEVRTVTVTNTVERKVRWFQLWLGAKGAITPPRAGNVARYDASGSCMATLGNRVAIGYSYSPFTGAHDLGVLFKIKVVK